MIWQAIRLWIYRRLRGGSSPPSQRPAGDTPKPTVPPVVTPPQPVVNFKRPYTACEGLYKPLPIYRKIDESTEAKDAIAALAASAKKSANLTIGSWAKPIVRAGDRMDPLPAVPPNEPGYHGDGGLDEVPCVHPEDIHIAISASANTDNWLIIIKGGTSYEFYKAKVDERNGRVTHAKTIIAYDIENGQGTTNGAAITAGGYSALWGLVHEDEGPINHRLAIGIPGIQKGPPRPPGHATRNVEVQNRTSVQNYFREGDLLALQPFADLSNLSGREKDIAIAFRDRGAEVVDNSGSLTVNHAYTGKPNLPLRNIPWHLLERVIG